MIKEIDGVRTAFIPESGLPDHTMTVHMIADGTVYGSAEWVYEDEERVMRRAQAEDSALFIAGHYYVPMRWIKRVVPYRKEEIELIEQSAREYFAQEDA